MNITSFLGLCDGVTKALGRNRTSRKTKGILDIPIRPAALGPPVIDRLSFSFGLLLSSLGECRRRFSSFGEEKTARDQYQISWDVETFLSYVALLRVMSHGDCRIFVRRGVSSRWHCLFRGYFSARACASHATYVRVDECMYVRCTAMLESAVRERSPLFCFFPGRLASDFCDEHGR